MCGDYGNGITVYSGAQPTAAQILANWSNYKSSNSNFLVHFVGNYWDQPYKGNLLDLYNMSEATPINTGVASWAILYTNNILFSQLNAASIPNSSFLVLPVTTTAEKGVIRLADINIVSGVPLSITAGSLSTALF